MAVIESSWAKGGGVDDRLEIYGTRGTPAPIWYSADASPTWSCGRIRRGAEKAGSNEGLELSRFDDLWNGGYLQEMRYFVDCILRDEPAWLDGRVGTERARSDYAAYRSAGTGATVRFLSVCRRNQAADRPLDRSRRVL